MTETTRTILLLIVGVLALAPPSAVLATPAEELAKEGIELARQRDYAGAIDRLRDAVALEPEHVPIRFQLASLLASSGRFDEAMPEFAAVVERDPQNGAARRGEITALLVTGNYRQARVKLQSGLEALPRDGQIAHTLARLLATAPLDDVRNGALAVELARAVYEVKQNYETGETVAMALAEAGDFDAAIAHQRDLLTRAEQSGDEGRLEGLRERLLTFLRSEAWRATNGAEIAMATEPPIPR